MFCKNCGQQMGDDAAFCSHCGTAVVKLNPSVTVEEDTANPTDENTVDNNTNTNNKKNDKKINICAIIGFVLSICSWFFALFIHYHEYVCTAIGAAALALSIVGIVFVEKKNYNLKGVAIAGLVIATVAVVLWPLTLL